MATTEILRKDSNGHIISKENKDYHICIKDNIDIIDVESYKQYNKLTEDEDCNEEISDSTKAESFIENYQKINVEKCPNKDPNSVSRGGCNIF